MDKAEAGKVLSEFVEALQEKEYDELVRIIGSQNCVEVKGSSGAHYQIEYEVLRDAEPNGPLRVVASIDDGGLFAAMFPITDSFLVDRTR